MRAIGRMRLPKRFIRPRTDIDFFDEEAAYDFHNGRKRNAASGSNRIGMKAI
jgi:hypothetical protein